MNKQLTSKILNGKLSYESIALIFGASVIACIALKIISIIFLQ